MSTMKKVPIQDATDDQLREHASLTLQLESITSDSPRAEVLAAIQSAGWPNDWIMVEGEHMPQMVDLGEIIQKQKVEQPAGQVLANNAEYADDPVVWLKVLETELPGGKDPVPVAVNGKTLVIQRGLLAPVPYRFFEVLQASVHGVLNWNEKTNEITETSVTRFPVQIDTSRLPSAAEIAAWQQRTAEQVAA